jgi:hypothetical protein
VESCGNNIYCCAVNYDCCKNSTSIFTLGVANIVTTIPAMENSKTDSPTAGDPTSAAQATSTTATNSNSESAPSNAVVMGVGIGIGVGGLSLFLIAFIFLFRYKRRKTFTSDTTEIEDVLELDAGKVSKLPKSNESEGKFDHALRVNGPRQEMCGEPFAIIPKEPQELEHEPIFELEEKRNT